MKSELKLDVIQGFLLLFGSGMDEREWGKDLCRVTEYKLAFKCIAYSMKYEIVRTTIYTRVLSEKFRVKMVGLHLGVGLYVDLKKCDGRGCATEFSLTKISSCSLKSLITIYFATVATLSTSYAVNSFYVLKI